MKNAGIIRNRLKIQSAIYNANKIKEIQETGISFHEWLIQNKQPTKEAWVLLFKKNFKFVGGEIVNEFLMSINFLPGAHDTDCEYYKKVK